MKKLCLVLLMCMFLGACAPTQKTEATANKPEEVLRAKIEDLKGEFEAINTNDMEALFKSRSESPSLCVLIEKYSEYESVRMRYFELSSTTDPEFGKTLDDALAKAGKDKTSAAYREMKEGRELDCRSTTDNVFEGTYAVELAADWIREFGLEEGEGSDKQAVRKVVRGAYLAAAKLEAKKLVEGMRVDPSDTSYLSVMTSLINRAKDWQFTAKDLGIPDDIAQKATS
jgi:hypothetical protein